MNRGHLDELTPYADGRKRWRYRAPAPTIGNAKRKQHSAVFAAPVRKAADVHATALQAGWDAHDKAHAAAKGTVGEIVAAYVEHRAGKDSPTTIYRRASIVARINADLGRIRCVDLTARHIDRWYDELAKPHRGRTLSPNTVRQYAATLRAILQQGYKWDMIAFNVADKATPPKSASIEQAARMPTLEALGRMIPLASRSVRIAVMLGAVTGCRRGEIVGLRWSDLDGNMLTVRRSLAHVPGGALVTKETKTGQTKTIPLPKWAVQDLAAYRDEAREWAKRERVRYVADGPILAHQRADATGRTPYSPDWLSQEWERLCDRAKVPRYKFHGLRHLHDSVMMSAGVSAVAAAKRTGHGVAVMLDRYAHSLTADDERAAQVISDQVGPAFQRLHETGIE